MEEREGKRERERERALEILTFTVHSHLFTFG